MWPTKHRPKGGASKLVNAQRTEALVATEAIHARLRKSHGTSRNDRKNVVDIDPLFDCCGRSRALPCQGDLDPFGVSSVTEFHVEPNMRLDRTVAAR